MSKTFGKHIGSDELSNQIQDPCHVFIKYKSGLYWTHSSEHVNQDDRVAFNKGDRVRFTFLAASRVVEAFGLKGVTLEPCPA